MQSRASRSVSAPGAAVPRGPKQWQIVAIMLFGSTLWGLYWWPLRELGRGGLPGLWAIALVYLGATAGFGWMARGLLGELRRHRLRVLGIGISATIAGISFSLGMIHGEVARVMILFYLSPVWAVVLARVLLHERLLPATIPALVLAIIGAGLLLWPAEGRPLDGFSGADVLGLVSGLGFAFTNLQLRAGTTVPARLKNLAVCFLVPPVAIALALALRIPANPFVPSLVAGFLVGLIWMTAMTAATQYGISRLALQRSSVLLLWELVVGAVSAALLAGEGLTPMEIAGGLCIVLAGLAVAWTRRSG